MAEATEATTTDKTWQTFDDDQAFLQHILSQKPAEELVDVPEWRVQILCRALNADTRIKVQMLAYDEKTKLNDYRNIASMTVIVMEGCYNPTTGHKVFTESHRSTLMKQQDGGAIERLVMAVLRLSGMLASNTERAKKN